jgi:membrane-associated phospholipid phosphatase
MPRADTLARMQLATIAAPVAAAPPEAPAAATPAPLVDVDTTLAPNGIKMPKVPGLPDWTSPGSSLGDVLAPPKPDSAAGKAELAVVHAIQKLRTPEGDAWALDMAKHGALAVWRDFAKRHRDNTGRIGGWLDTALLAGTLAATAGATQLLKHRYDRLRPFQVDPKIVPPVPKPFDASYPSGHASSAFAAARVIAVLEPGLAKEAYELATKVAVSRVYAGVHFPSDVVVGALLGTGVAEGILRKAGKRPRLEVGEV